MTSELTIKTHYNLKHVEALTLEVLDHLHILEHQYYENEFMRPLVNVIVAHVLSAVPADGRLLLIGGSPFLAYCLLEQGFQADVFPIGEQVMPEELRPYVRGTATLEALVTPPLPFGPGGYDAAVLPCILEGIPGDPVPFFYRLRRFLASHAVVVLATTNLSKVGTRWRALAGRDFLPSWLQGPQQLPGEWPAIRYRRFYSRNEVGLLARCAGYRVSDTNYTVSHRAFSTLQPVSLPRWVLGNIKYALCNAWPHWRDYYAVTLHVLPNFDFQPPLATTAQCPQW